MPLIINDGEVRYVPMQNRKIEALDSQNKQLTEALRIIDELLDISYAQGGRINIFPDKKLFTDMCVATGRNALLDEVDGD